MSKNSSRTSAFAGKEDFNTLPDNSHKPTRSSTHGLGKLGTPSNPGGDPPKNSNATRKQNKLQHGNIRKNGLLTPVPMPPCTPLVHQEIVVYNEQQDEELLQVGKMVTSEELKLADFREPTAEDLRAMERDLESNFAKVKQTAVAKLGVVAREHFDLPAVQAQVLKMLQMFGEESVKTPLARSIMTALASMTVHPGARNLLQASAPKVLEMATRGGRAIREKTCLALMNLVTNKECRDVLIEKGVIRVLLDLLQEGSGEEEDPGAGFLEYVVGALCNISNAGFHEKKAIHDADGEVALVALVARNVDNLATQRCALLLQHLGEHVPGSASRTLELAQEVEALRPMTKNGDRGRHMMHPAKVVAATLPQND